MVATLEIIGGSDFGDDFILGQSQVGDGKGPFAFVF